MDTKYSKVDSSIQGTLLIQGMAWGEAMLVSIGFLIKSYEVHQVLVNNVCITLRKCVSLQTTAPYVALIYIYMEIACLKYPTLSGPYFYSCYSSYLCSCFYYYFLREGG